MSKLTKFFKHPVMFFEDAAKNKNLKEGKPKIFVVGFSTWKTYLRMYFSEYDLIFLPKDIKKNQFNSQYRNKILSLKDTCQVFIWGFKAPEYILEFLREEKVSTKFVEDGFVRSVQLGATKAPPMSLCLDSKTPYFDATRPSELEDLLNNFDFSSSPELLDQAKEGIKLLLETGVSKYNNSRSIDVEKIYGFKTSKRILVLGQVEDDASIQYGCSEKITNNDLVRIAVSENPDAQVIYKPHPDVMNGYRSHQSSPEDVKDIALVLINDIPLSNAFETTDHVYTITSLGGFEALLRGIKVTTLGCPFYSGWGLTDDRQRTVRRKVHRSLEEFFAISYLVYPRYFDIESGEKKSFFDVVESISLLKSSQMKVEESGYQIWLDTQEERLSNSIFKNIEIARQSAFHNRHPSIEAGLWLATRLKDTEGPNSNTLKTINSLCGNFSKLKAVDNRKLTKLKVMQVNILVQAAEYLPVEEKAKKLKEVSPLGYTMATNAALYRIGLGESDWAKKCLEYMQLSNKSQHKFEEILSDKSISICVVGNSPIEVGAGRGEEIDNHDFVIRFNNFSDGNQFKGDYGKKCNAWLKAGGYGDLWRRDIFNFEWVIFSGPDKRYHSVKYGDLFEIMEQDVSVSFIPSSIYVGLVQELQYPPSAGLLFLYWLKHLRGNLSEANVSIYGFSMEDQSDNQSKHYFKNYMRKDSYSHNWSAESEFLKNVIFED